MRVLKMLVFNIIVAMVLSLFVEEDLRRTRYGETTERKQFKQEVEMRSEVVKQDSASTHAEA